MLPSSSKPWSKLPFPLPPAVDLEWGERGICWCYWASRPVTTINEWKSEEGRCWVQEEKHQGLSEQRAIARGDPTSLRGIVVTSQAQSADFWQDTQCPSILPTGTTSHRMTPLQSHLGLKTSVQSSLCLRRTWKWGKNIRPWPSQSSKLCFL